MLAARGSPTTGFSLALTPVTGLNTLSLRTLDANGNTSGTFTSSFKVTRPLVVSTTGLGSVTAGFAPSSFREVGKPFTITATPATGQVFQGWTTNDAGGAGLTPTMMEGAKISFTHREGLVLTANFIANPFTAAMIGKFNGLITPSATLPGGGTVGSHETFGLLSGVTVQSNGTFSGKVLIDGLALSIGGSFDHAGVARFGLARDKTLTLTRIAKPGLEVALAMDLTGATHKITGKITQRWRGVVTAVSDIDADRAFFSTTNKMDPLLAATATKAYTLVFKHRTSQPGLSTTDYPQGDGYATGSIKNDGTVTFAGKLADHAAFSQTVPLSQASQWPLFAQLYGSKGSIVAMMTVNASQTDTDMTSTDVHWFRLYQSTQWYPWGWPEGIAVDVIGARYALPALPGLLPVNPATGNATLTFSDGQLPLPLIKNINISATNVATKAPTTDASFVFTLAASTGAISGTSFNHSNGTKPAWQGVLFQKGANKGGYGYFMTVSPKLVDGLGESGLVKLLAK